MKHRGAINGWDGWISLENYAAADWSTFPSDLLVELSEPVRDGVVPPVHLHLVPLLLVDVRTNLQGSKRMRNRNRSKAEDKEIHPKYGEIQRKRNPPLGGSPSPL